MSTTQRKDDSHLFASLCTCQLKVQEDQQQPGGSSELSPVFSDFLVICMSGERVGWCISWDVLIIKCFLNSEERKNSEARQWANTVSLLI